MLHEVSEKRGFLGLKEALRRIQRPGTTVGFRLLSGDRMAVVEPFYVCFRRADLSGVDPRSQLLGALKELANEAKTVESCDATSAPGSGSPALSEAGELLDSSTSAPWREVHMAYGSLPELAFIGR